MMNFLTVTTLAKRLGQPQSKVLVALQGIAKRCEEPLLHKLPQHGRKVWHVDMDVLEDIYLHTPAQLKEIALRLDALEREIYGTDT